VTIKAVLKERELIGRKLCYLMLKPKSEKELVDFALGLVGQEFERLKVKEIKNGSSKDL